MDVKNVLKQAMKESKITQKQLAEELGIKSQSAISDKLNRGTMSIATFIEMLDIMGYELIVRKKSSPDIEIKVTSIQE